MAGPQPTIICGVTCACAGEQKAAARASAGEPKTVDCVAHDECEYAKRGECSCAAGQCVSSQNKTKCSLATEGKCDCAAGECKKMTAIKKECSSCPGCDCAAGECKKATLPIS